MYHKSLSSPLNTYSFGAPPTPPGADPTVDSMHFISATCWKGESPTVLAANSLGMIKVMTLVE